MERTLLEQAVVDAKSIREAAEKVVKAEMLEQMIPHIKALVNKRLLMEEEDKSAEKEAIEDETDPMEKPTDGFEQSDEAEKQVSQEPDLNRPALSMDPQEPVENPSLPGELADSVDQVEPTSDMPSEMSDEALPTEDFSDVPPESTGDVPPADFDDELTIELKPMVNTEGGIEDLPEEKEDEMSNDIKESFLKRKSIREALDEIPELKASVDEEGIVSEEFCIDDIPAEERIEEDVNLTLNFSDSDSDECDLPNFLKDETNEESEMTEERFVEEAKKLYKKKMEEKKGKDGKKGLKEFYIPSEVGFKYGKEMEVEKDSHLFPIKKETHFEKVLPPEVKKWIVEADKKIKMYDKQLSEQNLVSCQMRLLIKGLVEHNIGKKGFLRLVEALDTAKSVNESNKTFARVIKEGFEDEIETFEPEIPEEKAEDSINESQVLRFKQLAKIRD